jgi:hypothetical protein
MADATIVAIFTVTQARCTVAGAIQGAVGPLAIVTPLAKDDRILIWDLCNEPAAHDLNSDPNKREFAWLSEIAATVRGCGVQQPITIGTMNGIVGRTGNVETFAPLVDVLCAHPYAHDRDGLEKLITGYHALRQTQATALRTWSIIGKSEPPASSTLLKSSAI